MAKFSCCVVVRNWNSYAFAFVHNRHRSQYTQDMHENFTTFSYETQFSFEIRNILLNLFHEYWTTLDNIGQMVMLIYTL